MDKMIDKHTLKFIKNVSVQLACVYSIHIEQEGWNDNYQCPYYVTYRKILLTHNICKEYIYLYILILVKSWNNKPTINK